MIRLPKPACPKSGTRQPENLYTEAQLKQAVRDALEDAAEKLERLGGENPIWISTVAASAAIRALIKEIDA